MDIIKLREEIKTDGNFNSVSRIVCESLIDEIERLENNLEAYVNDIEKLKKHIETLEEDFHNYKQGGSPGTLWSDSHYEDEEINEKQSARTRNTITNLFHDIQCLKEMLRDSQTVIKATSREVTESVKNDSPDHPLHKRLMAVADWLVVLAPTCYVGARAVVLKAAAVIKAAQEQEPFAEIIGVNARKPYHDIEAYWRTYELKVFDEPYQSAIAKIGDKLYAHPVPDQSPAKDDADELRNYIENCIIECAEPDALDDVSISELSQLATGIRDLRARLKQSPAGRITEQDVREIIESFNTWWSWPNQKLPGIITDHAAQVVPVYLHDQGRTLLNKLNSEREQLPTDGKPTNIEGLTVSVDLSTDDEDTHGNRVFGRVYGCQPDGDSWVLLAEDGNFNYSPAATYDEEILKRAYWNFDARVKGLPPHKAPCGQPEHAFVVSVLEAVGTTPAVVEVDVTPNNTTIWNIGDKVRVHGYPGTVVEADSLSELKNVVWVDVPEYNSICAYPVDSVWRDCDLLDWLKAYGLCEQDSGWLQDEAGKCADSCKDWPQWRENAVTGVQDSGLDAWQEMEQSTKGFYPAQDRGAVDD